MNENNDFALVPRLPSLVEKTGAGASRIQSAINADILALVRQGAEVQRVSANQAGTGQLDLWYATGYGYYHGQGVPQDYAEAVNWFRRAAELGHPGAQVYLGHCYKLGLGVPADGAEAAKWFRKAAEQEDHHGQFELGYCYSEGIGVPEDDMESLRWIGLAALQGHPGALSYFEGVADWLEKEGHEVPKDPVEAVSWEIARLDHL